MGNTNYGVIYYKDGTTEPIVFYRKHDEDYIEFYTEHDKYIFMNVIERVHRLSQRKVVQWYKSVFNKTFDGFVCEDFVDVYNISRIELVED